MSAAQALEARGYCPRTTPVDTLMAAPYGVGLAVAEAMGDDAAYADDDLAHGFQEADFAEEHVESLLSRTTLPWWTSPLN